MALLEQLNARQKIELLTGAFKGLGALHAADYVMHIQPTCLLLQLFAD